MAPDVKISYPVPGQKILNAPKLRRAALRAFMFAGALCVMINLCTGGRAWSLIVLASLRLAWKGYLKRYRSKTASRRGRRGCCSASASCC